MSVTPRSASGSSLLGLSAVQIARLIRTGEISATEVVERYIRRIEATHEKLNAVVVPLFKQARAEARETDDRLRRRRSMKPLQGVPITVKESFPLAGTPATAGIASRKATLATADHPLVARLRSAGAIVLGKTNVSQLLLYPEADNPVYGRTNNPWDLTRAPGGSSGGEAAIIATGASALGLGSDIGGSVRLPAHSCGLHAIKPTSNRLTRVGLSDWVEGFEGVLDSAGLIGRTVADLRVALAVLVEPEPLGPDVPPSQLRSPESSVEGLRIAYYLDDGWLTPSPAIRRAVTEAAEALKARGAHVEQIEPPDANEAMAVYLGLMSADNGASLWRALGNSPRDPRIKQLETFSRLPGFLQALGPRIAELLGRKQQARILRCLGGRSVAEYHQLVARRDRLRTAFLERLQAGQFNAILCPPAHLPALTHGASLGLGPCWSYTMLFNLLGMPAGVVSATRVKPGEESDRTVTKDPADQLMRRIEEGSSGLPVGVQVASWHWREDIVLTVMGALEAHFSMAADYPAHAVV